MANRLTKDARIYYDPGQAAAAAIAESREVVFYFPVYRGWQTPSGWFTTSNDDVIRANDYYYTARGGTVTFIKPYPYKEGAVWRSHEPGAYIFWHPAIAAKQYVPPTVRVDALTGWNAKGDSLYSSEGDFAFLFDYASYPTALVVGITADTSGGTLPTTVAAGVLLTDAAIAVVAGGGEVAQAPYQPRDQQRISIARIGEQVVVNVGDWVHTVDAGLLGRVHVRALLYNAGDYVDNPMITFPVEGSAAGRVGFRHAVPDFARARGNLGFRGKRLKSKGRLGFRCPPVAFPGRATARAGFRTALAKPGGVGAITLPGLSVFASDEATGSGAVRLEGLSVFGYGGFHVATGGQGIAGIAPPAVTARGLTGEVGSGDIWLPALRCIGADYPYGQGRVELPGFAVNAAGESAAGELDRAEMVAALVVDGQAEPSLVLFASIREELGVAVLMELSALLSADVIDSLSIIDTASLAVTIEAILREQLTVSDSLESMQRAAIQYATNLLTGAVTRYEGWDFHSFATVGMDAYAADEQGIYRITNATDPISAAIEFGAIGAGLGNGKRFEAVYLGLSTDGAVYVKVQGDDGREQTYRTLDRGGMLRAKTAKGVKARHWTTRLEIVDATELELDRIEWLMPISARRV